MAHSAAEKNTILGNFVFSGFQREDFFNQHDADIFFGSDKGAEYFFDKYAGPAGYLLLANDSLQIIKANEQYYAEHGTFRNENQVNGCSWQFLDDISEDGFLEEVRRAAADGKEHEAESWRIIFSQNCGMQQLCIHSTFHLVAQRQEQYLFYIKVSNVTEIKRKLQSVTDSEEKFRSMAEHANAYAWEYVVDKREMHPCSRCMRDLGLPAVVKNYPEPVIDSGLFPPDYADIYREWHHQIAQGVPKLEMIIPLTPDRIPFHVRYTTEFDNEGKPIRAFGSATLVVDNEKEHELKEIIATLGLEYTTIFKIDFVLDEVTLLKAGDVAPDWVKQLTDAGNTFPYHTGITRYLQEFAYPDELDGLLEAFKADKVQQALREKNEYTMTFRTIVDGFTHYELVRFFQQPKQSFVVCAVKNIDEAIKAQRKAEAKLEKALISAREANAAKTAFLSNMSHDIRTPLNGIIGLLEMSDRHNDDQQLLLNNRAKMRTAAYHLLSLVNDVLDLSKMEDMNTELAHEAFDLSSLVNEVNEMAGPVATEKDVVFYPAEISGAISHPCVYGSPLHIKRIFLNIVNNAIKYNRPGGSVTCQASCYKHEGKIMLQYKVADTGIGMSEEFQKRMFEPFTQENTDARSVYNGTGLGMSIVKALVEKMDGKIDVYSVQNEGTTFTLTLPLEKADSAQLEQPVAALDRISLAGRRILLVEDNELNAEIAQMLFEDCGAVVSLAVNGLEAVEKIRNHPPYTYDVVLMDINMPVLNGLDATKVIRHMDREDAGKLPIIAMTASAFSEDVANCKDAGMNAHIAKPINVTHTLQTIAKYLD